MHDFHSNNPNKTFHLLCLYLTFPAVFSLNLLEFQHTCKHFHYIQKLSLLYAQVLKIHKNFQLHKLSISQHGICQQFLSFHHHFLSLMIDQIFFEIGYLLILFFLTVYLCFWTLKLQYNSIFISINIKTGFFYKPNQRHIKSFCKVYSETCGRTNTSHNCYIRHKPFLD